MMRSIGHCKGQKCILLRSQGAGMVRRELLYLAPCPGRLGFMLWLPHYCWVITPSLVRSSANRALCRVQRGKDARMSLRSHCESPAVANEQFLTKWGGWNHSEIKTCLSFCCTNLYSNFICRVRFSFIRFPVWRDLSRIDNPNFEHKSLGCMADRCFALSYDNGWLEAGRENARGLSLWSSIRMAGGRGGSGTRWGRFVFIYLFVYFKHLNLSRDTPGCCWELRQSGSAKALRYEMRAGVPRGRLR